MAQRYQPKRKDVTPTSKAPGDSKGSAPGQNGPKKYKHKFKFSCTVIGLWERSNWVRVSGSLPRSLPTLLKTTAPLFPSLLPSTSCPVFGHLCCAMLQQERGARRGRGVAPRPWPNVGVAWRCLAWSCEGRPAAASFLWLRILLSSAGPWGLHFSLHHTRLN